jgi:hypothetical protein
MVLEIVAERKSVKVPMPPGFTPLSKLGVGEEIDREQYRSQATKTPREYMVTHVAGIVRRREDHFFKSYPKIVLFMNAQDTENNSTGYLDYPVSVMARDFADRNMLSKIEINEGDTVAVLNVGVMREEKTLSMRYTGVTKYTTTIIVYPKEHHFGDPLTEVNMHKILRIYLCKSGKMPFDKPMRECINLLKRLRGLQFLDMDRTGINNNEFIQIADVTLESRFLADPGNVAFNHGIVKASLIVEVLWVYNNCRMEQEDLDEYLRVKKPLRRWGNSKPTALLQVTDYTRNELLGCTAFATPYGCDFQDTALYVRIWEQAGFPFNAQEIVAGDLLHLSNVAFYQCSGSDGDSGTTRQIEAQISGRSAHAASIKLIRGDSTGPLEEEFAARREAYLRTHMHNAPGRQRGSCSADHDHPSRAGGVPPVGMGIRRGEPAFMVLDKLFYDAPQVSLLTRTDLEGNEIKRTLKREHSSNNNDASNAGAATAATSTEVDKGTADLPAKKKRKYPPVTISPLVETKEGKPPDGLAPCYRGGTGLRKFDNKYFVILCKIIRTLPSSPVDWVSEGQDSNSSRGNQLNSMISSSPIDSSAGNSQASSINLTYNFTLYVEGQDSVVMPVQCRGDQAEYFLGVRARDAARDPTCAMRALAPVLSSIGTSIWVRLLVRQQLDPANGCIWSLYNSRIIADRGR